MLKIKMDPSIVDRHILEEMPAQCCDPYDEDTPTDVKALMKVGLTECAARRLTNILECEGIPSNNVISMLAPYTSFIAEETDLLEKYVPDDEEKFRLDSMHLMIEELGFNDRAANYIYEHFLIPFFDLFLEDDKWWPQYGEVFDYLLEAVVFVDTSEEST